MEEELEKIIKDNYISYNVAMKIFMMGYISGNIKEHERCHNSFMMNGFI